MSQYDGCILQHGWDNSLLFRKGFLHFMKQYLTSLTIDSTTTQITFFETPFAFTIPLRRLLSLFTLKQVVRRPRTIRAGFPGAHRRLLDGR